VKYFLLSFIVSVSTFAFEISSVKVQGEHEALVQFHGVGPKPSAPTFKVAGNTIEVSLGNAILKDVYQGKLDVSSPHALVHRVSVYETSNKLLKATIVVNGSLEGLKNRVSFGEGGDAVNLKIEYPKVGNSTLDLLKEEQLPIQEISTTNKKEAKSFQWVQLVLFFVVMIAAGVGTFFVVKFAKAKGAWGGSRKYLIEQLSYVPIGGTKSGVALVKVGSEFVLLGVTPNQVSFLSSLPKLTQNYEEETLFEKNTFKEAVQEQIRERSINV
jgi:flagellar biogenesis protein FliO